MPKKTPPLDPIVIVVAGNVPRRVREMVAQLRAAAENITPTYSEHRAAEEHALLVASRILEDRRVAVELAERAKSERSHKTAGAS